MEHSFVARTPAAGLLFAFALLEAWGGTGKTKCFVTRVTFMHFQSHAQRCTETGIIISPTHAASHLFLTCLYTCSGPDRPACGSVPSRHSAQLASSSFFPVAASRKAFDQLVKSTPLWPATALSQSAAWVGSHRSSSATTRRCLLGRCSTMSREFPEPPRPPRSGGRQGQQWRLVRSTYRNLPLSG